MKRLVLFFAFIVFQIGLTLVVGYLAIDAAARLDTVMQGTSYRGIDLSGAAFSDARGIIETTQREVIMADSAAASFRYRDILFEFGFSEIGLKPNPSAILSALDDRASTYYLSRLFSGFSRGYRNEIVPEFSADPELFRAKLYLMKNYIDAEPVGAFISCSEDGVLTRMAAKYGALFDVDAVFDEVYTAFLKNPDITYSLEATDATLTNPASDTTGGDTRGNLTLGQSMLPVVTVTIPDVTNDMLQDVDTLLADVEVEIPDRLDADLDPDLLARAVKAVDTVWIPGNAATEFSFNRYLAEAGIAAETQSPECSAVASVLMYALLVAGEDYDKISYERLGSSLLFGEGLGDDDRMYGFEVSIQPDSPDKDLRFINTLSCDIVMFCSVVDGIMKVRIAGDEKFTGAGAAPFRVYTEYSESTNSNIDITDRTQLGTVRMYRNGEQLDIVHWN